MSKYGGWALFFASMIFFAFSVGTLTARSAVAQSGQNNQQFFPRQSDLWSFSANAEATWWDDGGNNKGHLLVAQRDPRGRVPVLTTTHLRYGLEIHPVIAGVMQAAWVDTPPPATYASESTGFGSTGGVILTPGSYLIMSSNLGPQSSALLLSGYWASP